MTKTDFLERKEAQAEEGEEEEEGRFPPLCFLCFQTQCDRRFTLVRTNLLLPCPWLPLLMGRSEHRGDNSSGVEHQSVYDPRVLCDNPNIDLSVHVGILCQPA